MSTEESERYSRVAMDAVATALPLARSEMLPSLAAALSWIHTAMQRALKAANSFGLDLRLVSNGQPSRVLLGLPQEFG
jgi:hypothetical protein